MKFPRYPVLETVLRALFFVAGVQYTLLHINLVQENDYINFRLSVPEMLEAVI